MRFGFLSSGIRIKNRYYGHGVERPYIGVRRDRSNRAEDWIDQDRGGYISVDKAELKNPRFINDQEAEGMRFVIKKHRVEPLGRERSN